MRMTDLWVIAPWTLVACVDEGPIRQITVPASFQPRDVTATHVWGIRRDELDVGYVTGLRLVPGPETGSQ